MMQNGSHLNLLHNNYPPHLDIVANTITVLSRNNSVAERRDRMELENENIQHILTTRTGLVVDEPKTNLTVVMMAIVRVDYLTLYGDDNY